MNLIAFDMDGVIVDVSSSYREMIPLIARKFFEPSPDAAALPTPIISLEDIAWIRNQGGWNNDWDLSALVISLALSTMQLAIPESAGDAWTLWRTTLQSCKLTGLIDYLNSVPMPISTRFRQLGAFRHPFVDLMDQGDIETGNVIRRLFQELYLGSDLFRATYSLEPKSHRGPGLIETERLLIPVSFFERLSEQHILAIATGRPFAEAFYTLRLFGIENYFSRILTLDDCDLATDWTLALSHDRPSLEKPDPFMLNAIYAGLERPVEGQFYIGDMPDDMKAAKRASPSFTAIGLLSSDAAPEELKRRLVEAGADMLVESVDELERIVTGSEPVSPVQHP
ncbi:HAD family hydrolase [Desulfatirhabdium butyrativorans]|uniref:HAD family hydrolase n=1 Tax=Desulfatirhabdium butyrativorans TaxID=340467 RepID=UPI0003FCF06F|nr:HAD family hydrolase [Desulfatirhabdium butyrativorans]